MKQNLIITGIKETKGEDCKKIAIVFMKEKLKMTQPVNIVKAHRIGKPGADKHNLIVMVSDIKDKLLVFKHAKNLKGVKSPEGEEYYISNQLPVEQEEQVRKRRLKIKINRNLIDAQQQDLTWKKGELMVDSAQYEERVIDPTCTDILAMNKDEIRRILSFKIYPGKDKCKNGSTFMGFAARVHSIQNVIDAYKQLRYRFLDAEHVICAYRIMDPDIATMTDCSDGGELGAGRRLLQMLLDEAHENIAVYVVCFHNGPNLGAARFELIMEAAKDTQKCSKKSGCNTYSK